MLRALPAELSWLMAYAVRIELTFTNRTSIVLLSALRIDICVRLTRIALEHSASSGTTGEACPLPNCDHIDVPTTNQIKKGGGAGGRTWTSDKQIPILMLLYALLQSTNYFVRCSTIWATPACSIISNNPDSIKLTALDIIFCDGFGSFGVEPNAKFLQNFKENCCKCSPPYTHWCCHRTLPFGAGGGDRTRTGYPHGILSPVCLPVPSHQQIGGADRTRTCTSFRITGDLAKHFLTN